MRAALAIFLLAGAGCSLIYSLDGFSGSGPVADAGQDGPLASPDAGDAAPDARDAAVDAGASLYAQAVLADTPAAYYRFEETTLGPALDSSGNGHNATYVGGVVLGATGALAKETSHAVRLDGTTAFVRVGDLFHFEPRKPMSLETWAKPDLVDNEYRGIITNEPDRAPNRREGYLLWNHATDGLGFERFRDGGVTGGTSPALPVGTYSHLVVTYDGTTVRGYVNAQELSRFDSLLDLTAPPDSVMAIGARVSGLSELFAGSLDEVAIYDHVLTPGRIAIHYQLGAGL